MKQINVVDSHILEEAIRGQKFDLVEWLCRRQCIITPQCIDLAIRTDFRILKMLYDLGGALPGCPAIDTALRMHREDIAEWLVTIGTVLCEKNIIAVARDGNIEGLNWLHVKKCPMTSEAFSVIIPKDRRKMFAALVAVGCPIT